jgi:hypothetical protein
MKDLVPRLVPALVIVVLVVSVDVTVFRGHQWTWERLAANAGIVLLTGAFWLRFARRS